MRDREKPDRPEYAEEMLKEQIAAQQNYDRAVRARFGEEPSFAAKSALRLKGWFNSTKRKVIFSGKMIAIIIGVAAIWFVALYAGITSGVGPLGRLIRSVFGIGG